MGITKPLDRRTKIEVWRQFTEPTPEAPYTEGSNCRFVERPMPILHDIDDEGDYKYLLFLNKIRVKRLLKDVSQSVVKSSYVSALIVREQIWQQWSTGHGGETFETFLIRTLEQIAKEEQIAKDRHGKDGVCLNDGASSEEEFFFKRNQTPKTRKVISSVMKSETSTQELCQYLHGIYAQHSIPIFKTLALTLKQLPRSVLNMQHMRQIKLLAFAINFSKTHSQQDYLNRIEAYARRILYLLDQRCLIPYNPPAKKDSAPSPLPRTPSLDTAIIERHGQLTHGSHGPHLTSGQTRDPLLAADPVASQEEVRRLDTLNEDSVGTACTFLSPEDRASLANTSKSLYETVTTISTKWYLLDFAFGTKRRKVLSEEQLWQQWFTGHGGETFETFLIRTFLIRTLLLSMTRPLKEWKLDVKKEGKTTKIKLQYDGRNVVSCYGLAKKIFGDLPIHCEGRYGRSPEQEAERQCMDPRWVSKFRFTFAGEPRLLRERLQQIVQDGQYLEARPDPGEPVLDYDSDNGDSVYR